MMPSLRWIKKTRSRKKKRRIPSAGHMNLFYHGWGSTLVKMGMVADFIAAFD
jgi:hypothetical protein